jgi:hypothetical protein
MCAHLEGDGVKSIHFCFGDRTYAWRVLLNAAVIQNPGRQQEMSLCACMGGEGYGDGVHETRAREGCHAVSNRVPKGGSALHHHVFQRLKSTTRPFRMPCQDLERPILVVFWRVGNGDQAIKNYDVTIRQSDSLPFCKKGANVLLKHCFAYQVSDAVAFQLYSGFGIAQFGPICYVGGFSQVPHNPRVSRYLFTIRRTKIHPIL